MTQYIGCHEGPSGFGSGRPRLAKQQRRKLSEILSPLGVGVRSLARSEGVFDLLFGEQIGKFLRPCEHRVLLAASDPESFQLGVGRLRISQDLREPCLEVSRSRGTEHSESTEAIKIPQSDLQRLS